MSCDWRNLLAIWLLALTLASPGTMANNQGSASLPATQSALFARLGEHLRPPAEGLQGRFRQQRELPFLQRPVISSGRFRLHNGGDIDWVMELPEPSITRIRDGVLSIDGRTLDTIPAAALLQALAGGDTAALARHFAIVQETAALPADGSDAAAWQVTLIPRAHRLQSLFHSLHLSGARYLQQLQVDQGEGNITLIEFTEVRAQGNPASDKP
ncbi:LolA family protein [Parahaliea aestuarii]|uniref:Outer membrane lipoprotein carrier protein LolA n=1 Tax=Parahaliea aestuarii TaxID=1852021 RepID=A0A5C8ZS11_9GAMM|nr:outer membrane lipoprotein carrier protein LolA [Parahaliea aestuarii]TXS90450.1 outer membrane lipoprotein carrier protein LolA [Parahaliea aestuarii]